MHSRTRCGRETKLTDIYMVGLGILNVDQITKETEHVLRHSQEVLFVDTGIATRRYLESLCPRVTPLYETSYRESECRLASYDHMAVRVIEAAFHHRPITFAMGGHPVVGAEAPFLIHEMARLLKLEVQTLPAVSAMDCLFAELMLDPCLAGLQTFEATDLLLRQYPLQADVPALIWQVGAVETRLHTLRPSTPARFERFQRHLLRYYPANHQLVAYYATPHPLMRSQQLTFSIAELGNFAKQLHVGFTLFIPPVGSRPIVDQDLRDKLDQRDHLNRLTR